MSVEKQTQPSGFVEILHRRRGTSPPRRLREIFDEDYTLAVPAVRITEFNPDDVFSVVEFYQHRHDARRGIREFDLVTYFVSMEGGRVGVRMWHLVHESRLVFFDNVIGRYVQAPWTMNRLVEMPSDMRFRPFSLRPKTI